MSRLAVPAQIVACLFLWTGIVQAGPTDAQRCQAGKNKAAGKHAACVHKAESKRVTTGDAIKYAESVATCRSKFALKWADLELDAAGACPSTGDETDIGDRSDSYTDSIAAELAGGSLATCSLDLNGCERDLAVCDAAVGGAEGLRLKTGQTSCYTEFLGIIGCAGTGQDGEVRRGLSHAYTDNGDGTISDLRTGLMWEKLSYDGTVHFGGDLYSWDGAFGKIDVLNAASFAGYSDWRVPNANELVSIDLRVAPIPAVAAAFDNSCLPGCTVTTCSCDPAPFTGAGYWSSTSHAELPDQAYSVSTALTGHVSTYSKMDAYHVRAVRGGL